MKYQILIFFQIPNAESAANAAITTKAKIGNKIDASVFTANRICGRQLNFAYTIVSATVCSK